MIDRGPVKRKVDPSCQSEVSVPSCLSDSHRSETHEGRWFAGSDCWLAFEGVEEDLLLFVCSMLQRILLLVGLEETPSKAKTVKRDWRT